jgi:hypothetical protein
MNFRSLTRCVAVLTAAAAASCGGNDDFTSQSDAGTTGDGSAVGGSSGHPDAAADHSVGGQAGGAGKGGTAGTGNGGTAGTGNGGTAGTGNGGGGNAGADACVPETQVPLCQGKDATCGQLSGIDKCGIPFSVQCGDCGCGQTCDANKCVAASCSIQVGQAGCLCDGMCCGGICGGGTCCLGNGNSCGSGNQCGDNINCCSGQCNNGQCWGSALTCGD